MIISNTFKGFTGKELLALVTNDGAAVTVGDDNVIVTPMTMRFANQAEIASVSHATHVSVQTHNMHNAAIVRIADRS